MKSFDAAVIGGGLLGCFALRNLRRYNISTVLIETREDVCRGISRANSAIVYAGYDNKPGSLKARMCVRANGRFDELCRALDVPFCRCGSLMLSFGAKGDAVLEKKLSQGMENGVASMELLSGDEARAMEPLLSKDVTRALYAPTTGTVNPWQLGIAAFENAVRNGAVPMLSTKLLGIEKDNGGYILRTDKGDIFSKVVINCAGLQADKVQTLVYPCRVGIEMDGADYLVMDRDIEKPSHIIFQEREEGKGITAVPCTEGNLLLESAPRALTSPFASTHEGMDFIRQQMETIMPTLDMTQTIRSFGAVRPNPHEDDGKSINDFCIENPGAGFYSLVGIKTPGLTCADELGRYLAESSARYLQAGENADFDPVRPGIKCADGDIICQCDGVSRGEIIESIRRGAASVEAVKRRVGAGMGRCQGSRCSAEIELILEKYRNGTL